MNLYSQLIDTRSAHLGIQKWSGNQRWYAAEEEQLFAYAFRTFPRNEDEAEATDEAVYGGIKNGRRSFFRIQTIETAELNDISYVPDGLIASTKAYRYRQTFPWGVYGAIMEWAFASEAALTLRVEPISKRTDIQIGDEFVRIIDGPYHLVFRTSGFTEIGQDEDGVYFISKGHIPNARLSLAFHIDAEHALAEANDLMDRTEELRRDSADFWSAYLASCPVNVFEEDYSYFNTYLNQEIRFDKKQLHNRQLWHWWAVLINVADVAFNESTPYMAPDRTNWHGTWSNDGPESLCSLSLTNQHALARRCIAEYIRVSIDANGDLGWYTHSYGRSCIGHPGDSGYYSHGVSAIVHTVEFYIRHTGDKGILDEKAGEGRTVWETLKLYIGSVLQSRDSNQDGLLEMNNLWEGWDDKIIPFFSKASLHEWIEVITRSGKEEIAAFYQEKCYPVTTLYEQVFFLRALRSMRDLARMQDDESIESFSESHYHHVVNTIETRHWNPETEFYHDWDARGSVLAQSKNLDAFYYLYYVKDPARVEEMIRQYADPARFGLAFPPSLSADHPQFNPNGYWTGGYWPREMFYVALSLNRHGYKELAMREVVKALCSQDGCIIAENMNPQTGQLNTCMYTLAYSACLIIALKEIVDGNTIW